jgi:hypothetical protein
MFLINPLFESKERGTSPAQSVQNFRKESKHDVIFPNQ